MLVINPAAFRRVNSPCAAALPKDRLKADFAIDNQLLTVHCAVYLY
jgi:hypothetical protein